MKQNDFSLALILLLIAMVGFGFACFLSFNFLTLGNTSESIITASIFALTIGLLAWAAYMFKKAYRNFKVNSILEVVSLLLFAVAAFFAIKPFSHVFTVIDQKSEIESQMVFNISNAERMFEAY